MYVFSEKHFFRCKGRLVYYFWGAGGMWWERFWKKFWEEGEKAVRRGKVVQRLVRGV